MVLSRQLDSSLECILVLLIRLGSLLSSCTPEQAAASGDAWWRLEAEELIEIQNLFMTYDAFTGLCNTLISTEG